MRQNQPQVNLVEDVDEINIIVYMAGMLFGYVYSISRNRCYVMDVQPKPHLRHGEHK